MAKKIWNLLISKISFKRRQASHVEPVHMQFLKFDPPDFFGSNKPLEAEEWLKRMESIFDVMRVTDEEKMILAPFRLKGEARHWWDATKRLLTTPPLNAPQPSTPKVITWIEFVEAFNDHYFPMAYRYEQERAFIHEKQGQISINDFEAQFTALSRFAPDLVRTEEAKCRRFLDGLNTNIRRGVEPFEITNYADLVSKAKIVEKGLKEWKQEQEQYKKSRFDFSRLGAGSSKQQTQNFRPSGGQSRQNPRDYQGQSFQMQQAGQRSTTSSGGLSSDFKCYKCGVTGHIARNCTTQNPVICFHCNQPGHVFRYCPLRSGATSSARPVSSSSRATSQSPQRGRGSTTGSSGSHTQARVFAMTHQDAQATPDVVTGILSIYGKDAHILIDPGSTHSCDI
ncbi:uncharacterized protein LOC130788623 [Actinidia eriantha]|uniref:uncharacterized protein LOC130788623 n=1 Tax=Actinidia eriantha TaxID=165200 RepID=UPI00258DDFD9|nr:uncharacterized protein LOC130788623 [Actinidia eriantha]